MPQHRPTGMKMLRAPHFVLRALALFMLVGGGGLRAQIDGQLFAADVAGPITIQHAANRAPELLSKREALPAEGSTIVTESGAQTTLVFSNNTAAHLGEKTRLQIQRFSQTPFPAVRDDLDSEPSISQFALQAQHGFFALATGSLNPESRVTIRTPHAEVIVHGRKCAVEINDLETRVFLIEGRVDVSGHGSEIPAQTLRPGQQAIVRHAADRSSMTVAIQPIMDEQQAELDAHVSHASLARRRVLFDLTGAGSLRAVEMSPPEALPVTR